MLTSSRPLKDVFFCPEESGFYSHCLENLVLKRCLDGQSVVEFGSGDGSPVIKSLLRTEFNGSIQGFEINPLAYQVACSKIREHQLSHQYIVHNCCLFETTAPPANFLISNPPYLPALDNQLYQPLLHGGLEGITVTKKLLSLNYPHVLVLVSSYSNPSGLIRYAHSQNYKISDFVISPMPFGYYSSEPKVMHRIQELQRQGQAFYSKNIYLLAGVLFSQPVDDEEPFTDLSSELTELLTCLS